MAYLLNNYRIDEHTTKLILPFRRVIMVGFYVSTIPSVVGVDR